MGGAGHVQTRVYPSVTQVWHFPVGMAPGGAAMRLPNLLESTLNYRQLAWMMNPCSRALPDARAVGTVEQILPRAARG